MRESPDSRAENRGFRRTGRRRRTLPPGLPGSTIRAARLNDRVRDGNGCGPRAIITGQNRRLMARLHAASGIYSPCDCGPVATRLNVLVIGIVSIGSTTAERRSRTGLSRKSWTDQASRAISTARLSMLPCLHLRPINVVVSDGPSGSFRSGKIRLGGGFPLRCFQRFSRPDIATRRYPWRNSRYTRGQSIPVLSY